MSRATRRASLRVVRMFPLILLFVITSSVRALAGRAEPPFPDFSPDRIPDPPHGTRVVARVFDTWLTADSLGGSQASLDARASMLAAHLWKSVSLRYMEVHGLRAEEAEVTRLERRLADAGAPVPENDAHEFARAILIQWKIDRELYERYGGEVVWQLTDPLTPVAAYRSFLIDLEQSKVFAIRDADLREGFWRQFETPRNLVIPRDQVDFSTPWWERFPTADATSPPPSVGATASTTGAGAAPTTPLCSYEIRGHTVRFIFNAAYHAAATNGTTGSWSAMRDLPLRSVALAGDFNQWSTRAWSMRPVGADGSIFILDRSLDELGGSGEHPFKFVLNGEWWIEPSPRAPNRSATGLNNASANYVLRVP